MVSALFSLLLAFGLALWFWRPEPKLFSSPTAIRTNDAYLHAHAPGSDQPPFSDDIFKSIQVRKGDSNLSISLLSGSPLSYNLDYAPVAVHRASALETIEIEGGSIRLTYLAVATKPPPPPYGSSGSSMVSARYYTPDLKWVSLSELPVRIPREQQPLLAHSLPSARFAFACSNLADFKVLRFRAFDARTHYPLSTFHNLPYTSNSITFNCDLNLWHQTPIELVGTLALGPVQSYTLAPEEGAELKISNEAVKLLAICEGSYDHSNTMDDGKTNVTSFSRQEPPPIYPKNPFTLIFYHWPRAAPLPLEFECADESGRAVYGFARSVSEHLSTFLLDGDPKKLKTIRVLHYPNLHRLVVTLPELPGLPDQNRNLQNLFDLHIPSVRLAGPWNIKENLGHFVQMQVPYMPLSLMAYTNKFVPSYRSNTTARALFAELDSFLPSKYDQLIADPEKNEIRYEENAFARAFRILKDKLGIR